MQPAHFPAPLANDLSKEDFELKNVTSDSVTATWNSSALKAKAVEHLLFSTISDHPQHKSTFSLINVRNEKITLGSPKPSVSHRVIVVEDSLDNPTTDIGSIETLPEGKTSLHINLKGYFT